MGGRGREGGREARSTVHPAKDPVCGEREWVGYIMYRGRGWRGSVIYRSYLLMDGPQW